MDTHKRLEQLRQEHALETLRMQTLLELDCVQIYARCLEKLRRIEADHEFVKGLEDAKDMPQMPEAISNGHTSATAPMPKMQQRERKAATAEN